MDWPSFKKLLKVLCKDLKIKNVRKAKYGNNGVVVAPAVKLAIALRFFAGGSPLDLQLIYHVSKSYVYDCIWLVTDAINRRFQIKFPIDDVAKLQQLEAEFRAGPAVR